MKRECVVQFFQRATTKIDYPLVDEKCRTHCSLYPPHMKHVCPPIIHGRGSKVGYAHIMH
jgi:hypothetical protein